MKYYLIFILLFVFTYSKAQTQDDKALKKEVRKLKIEQLKKLNEQIAQAEQENNEKMAQITTKRNELNRLNEDEIKKRDEGIAYLEEKMRKAKKDRPEVNATKPDRANTKCSFSVQIGAYKNKDLTQYMESSPHFGIEIDEQNFKKYTLGFFTSYWEAKSFSKYLNQMGAQTYVVGFYNGKRIPDLKDMTDCTF
jgi:hypothetical protein